VFWLFERNHFTEKGLFVYLSSFLEITILLETVSKLVKLGFNSVSGAIRRSPRKQNLKQRWLDYMRLSLILPVVAPEQFLEPERCVHPKCKGKYFRMRQEVQKNVRDMQYEQVVARRYECLRCHRTFRVYPQGVLPGSSRSVPKGSG
jgi:hypothetical protein